MADKSIKLLPGFRDFTPENCAVRNYLFATWRHVAQRYGFVEYEAPMLEPTALYQKKTGEELNTQLFRFEDQGGRDVTLRPELTASLARIVTGQQRNYPKPMKWFEIGSCFRYERQQRGRTREFIQFNADIIGEGNPAADAELIALAIDTMIALGFTADDFVIRASDRQSWLSYCEDKGIDDVAGFLAIIDKIEREKPEVLAEKLSKFSLTADEVKGFINNPENASDDFKAIQDNLTARGLGDFIKLDLTIVRGLAYYTGTVFEIFDTSHSMRAIAGGGRYDDLLKTLSDGSVDLPCTGFAMGDVVIRNFIEETPHAKAKMDAWLKTQAPCDIFVVIADEDQRPHALKLVTELRGAGHKVEYPLTPAKFNKQFKTAEKLGATKAVIIGDEFPELQVNDLSTREKTSIPSLEALLKHL